ncbi:hypothetical protein D0862_05880 [Hortaea werneckii]|uniref:Nicotinamide-nucleotide adenylyltransferase n=1 Tax=Hortaea werneckii TaxID=91943 RepID=A0A3M7GP89_HORWE|nr:hypothetical protein D0862_05880 [Hortaea werneckii]
MTTDDMASRLSVYRSLVPQLSSALASFQSSGSKFKVLKTVHPTNLTPHDPQPPINEESPRTLFILDSSFNPPSIAHQSLAQSALHKDSLDVFSKPHRLLLLFATMNADKAPSAAAFEQRLTLMTVFAGDLIQSLRAQSDKYSVVPVDIGVTTVPYYTDKSAAIASSAWYPDSPKHIHLVGYDTLTRFFAAKYYKDFNPPFSALDPYFDAGHRLRVTLRPDDDYGSEAEQRAFAQSLEKGDMEKDGGKREWAKQLDLVPPNPKAGVSSTKVRKAAKAGEWSKVHELCTEGVMQYVKSEKLYDEDDRGAKMA